MKRLALLSFGIIVVFFLMRYCVIGVPLEEKGLIGKSQAEVRQLHGEPYAIIDDEPNDNEIHWQFAHGLLGVSTLIEFRNGIVVKVEESGGH